MIYTVKNSLHKWQKTFLILGFTALFSSCASDAPPAAPTSKTSAECEGTKDCADTETPSAITETGPVTDEELCSVLKDESKNLGLYAETFFMREIDFLCSQVVGKATVYRGNDSPSYVGTPEALDDNNDLFQMGSVSEVQYTTPKQFYSMMDLQLNRTSEFEAKGFEGDDKVTYTVKSSKDLTSAIVETNYDYKYEDPDDSVKNWSYTGRSNLMTLQSDRIYVIANRHSAGSDRLLDFRGLKVIVESSAGSKLFYVSYQKMDNGGGESGRTKTRDSVDSAMKDELAKDYRNGSKAKDL
jgi:hypothetical protein